MESPMKKAPKIRAREVLCFTLLKYAKRMDWKSFGLHNMHNVFVNNCDNES